MSPRLSQLKISCRACRTTSGSGISRLSVEAIWTSNPYLHKRNWRKHSLWGKQAYEGKCQSVNEIKANNLERIGKLLFDVHRVTSRGKCSIKQKSTKLWEKLRGEIKLHSQRAKAPRQLWHRYASWRSEKLSWNKFDYGNGKLMFGWHSRKPKSVFRGFFTLQWRWKLESVASLSLASRPKRITTNSRDSRNWYLRTATVTGTNVRNVILAFEPFDSSRKITLSIVFHNSTVNTCNSIRTT